MSVTRTPTPLFHSQATHEATGPLPESPCGCEIYVGHPHGPTMVQDQLNDRR